MKDYTFFTFENVVFNKYTSACFTIYFQITFSTIISLKKFIKPKILFPHKQNHLKTQNLYMWDPQK